MCDYKIYWQRGLIIIIMGDNKNNWSCLFIRLLEFVKSVNNTCLNNWAILKTRQNISHWILKTNCFNFIAYLIIIFIVSEWMGTLIGCLFVMSICPQQFHYFSLDTLSIYFYFTFKFWPLSFPPIIVQMPTWLIYSSFKYVYSQVSLIKKWKLHCHLYGQWIYIIKHILFF